MDCSAAVVGMVGKVGGKKGVELFGTSFLPDTRLFCIF